VSVVKTDLILNKKLKLWVCVCACSLIAVEGMNQFAPNLHTCTVKTGGYFRRVKLQKSVLGLKPGEVFSVP
jgi:hypothetical protein